MSPSQRNHSHHHHHQQQQQQQQQQQPDTARHHNGRRLSPPHTSSLISSSHTSSLFSRGGSSGAGARFNMFTIILFIFAVVALMINNNFQSLYYENHDTAIIEKLMETTGKLDAIVTVAMCGFHANEMVEALRNEGQWTNPIYVITDTPEAENSDLCTPINVKGNHPTSKYFNNEEEYKQYQIGSKQFNPEIWSKWHKTQLFQLIPKEDNINTILFLDADMLAQKSLTKQWLPSIAPLIANTECDLILNKERWYTKIPILGKHSRNLTGRYNSGMVIQKRYNSYPVNEEWSKLLVHEPFMGRDQGKLTEAIDNTETKIFLSDNSLFFFGIRIRAIKKPEDLSSGFKNINIFNLHLD